MPDELHSMTAWPRSAARPRRRRTGVALAAAFVAACAPHAPPNDPAPPPGSSEIPAAPAPPECPAAAPHRDPISGQCRACLEDAHCAAPAPRCEPAEHRCIACVADADCTDPATPRCDLGSKACVPAPLEAAEPLEPEPPPAAPATPPPREQRTQFVLLSMDQTPDTTRRVEHDTWVRLFTAMNLRRREGEPPNSFTLFIVPAGLQFAPGEDELTAEEEPYRGAEPRIGPAYQYAEDLDGIRALGQRIRELSDLGIEIASHSVRHLDARDWTAEQWRTELQDFLRILDQNGLPAPRGFRAPFLKWNDALYPELESLGFTYDSSRPGRNCWPARATGTRIWVFGVPSVSIPGDRNVLYFDLNMRTVLREAAAAEGITGREAVDVWVDEQYLEAGYRGFLHNYEGNRAPFLISGHGGFREQTIQLMKRICKEPDVRCATFSEATAYMDAHPELEGVCR